MELWKVRTVGTFITTFGVIFLGYTKLGTGCFNSTEIIGGLILLITSIIFSILGQIDRYRR